MSDVLKTWDKATQYLKEKLGTSNWELWISPLSPRQQNDHNLILQTPDKFFQDWLERNYRCAIEEALRCISSEEIILSLEINPKSQNAPVKTPAESLQTRPARPQDTANLNSRFTFENFVVGSSNRHAHAYSLAVSESPAKAYNPLFIYGGVGLGKTHLMQAICHQIKSKNPQAKVCYITSERFTNELIDGIQHHSTNNFRNKYRYVDILVIDDIQFIAGKESTQEEFFNTFNVLYDSHKQIIISSDRPPKEISNLQDRLVSRFSWGLATDIQAPDLETRVAILKKKIEREPVSVPDDVIFFIAQLIKTNIRELEGALIRIIAYALLEEKPITLELTKEVLRDLIKEPKKLITVDFIQRCVSEEFGVSLHDLKAKRRHKNIVLPRQIAMYISRELTELSLPEIGDVFGGKDHTTVLHSCKKIKDDLNKNTLLKDRVDRVIQMIQQ